MRIKLASNNYFCSVPSSSSWKDLRRMVSFLLNIEFRVEAILLEVFFMGPFKISNAISLIVSISFQTTYLIESILAICFFLRIFPFHQSFLICCQGHFLCFVSGVIIDYCLALKWSFLAPTHLWLWRDKVSRYKAKLPNGCPIW